MIILIIFCVTCLLSLSIIILLLYQIFSRFFKLLKKIPHSQKYPILGHFIEFAHRTSEDHFLNDRALAKEYYPIYHQTVLHVGVVNLLAPEDIEIVLTNTNLIKKSRVYDLLHSWLGTGLLTSDGNKWKSRRRLLTGTFHFSILQEFISIFNDCTTHLVKKLEKAVDKDFIDIVEPITECTLAAIAETSMGIKINFDLEINQKYKNAVHLFGSIMAERVVRPWLYEDFAYNLMKKDCKLKQIVKLLHEFSYNVISKRKQLLENSTFSYTAKKRLAMLDLLLNAQKQGENIDDIGIREEVDTFMFEGHDTTAVALSFIFLLLANNQKIQEEIRQEIIESIGDDDTLPTYTHLKELPFTERCLKECLRLYPSVPLIGRDTVEEFTTATGYTIPKGTMIHMHIYDLHRNPSIYPDPEKFDPDRFLPENVKNRHPFAYVPFSAGSRNCIGQKFAMLELKSVLCGILRKYYLEPVDTPNDIVFIRDLVLRSKNEIKVKFLKRSQGQVFK